VALVPMSIVYDKVQHNPSDASCTLRIPSICQPYQPYEPLSVLLTQNYVAG
jgi:hypothetical protein